MLGEGIKKHPAQSGEIVGRNAAMAGDVGSCEAFIGGEKCPTIEDRLQRLANIDRGRGEQDGSDGKGRAGLGC